MTEVLNTIKEAFNPTKFIDQAEKNTQAVLAYVEPKELSKTLVQFSKDTADYFRASVEAVETVGEIFKKQAESFAKTYTKSEK